MRGIRHVTAPLAGMKTKSADGFTTEVHNRRACGRTRSARIDLDKT